MVGNTSILKVCRALKRTCCWCAIMKLCQWVTPVLVAPGQIYRVDNG